jgi:hypothetical protein
LIIAIEFSEDAVKKVISGVDWGYMIALYFFLLVIRAAGVVLLYPLLRRGRFGANWRDGIMLSWAGLRGAVGLTLSLIVYNSDGKGVHSYGDTYGIKTSRAVVAMSLSKSILRGLYNSRVSTSQFLILPTYPADIEDAEYRHLQFFFVACAAVLTLLLQGSTTSMLLRALRYLDLPPAKRAAMQRCAEAVDAVGKKGVHRAQASHALLGDADWRRVQQLTDLNVWEQLERRPTRVRKRVTKWNAHVARRKKKETECLADPASLQREHLLTDLRDRLLQAVMAQYVAAFGSELLTPHEMHQLVAITEHALDEAEMRLSDWDHLAAKLCKLDALGQHRHG